VVAAGHVVSVVCPIPVVCSAVPAVGSGIAKAAANGVLDALTSALSTAADWLVGHVIDLVNSTTRVDLSASWFLEREGAMRGLLELVVAPLLMAASLGAVLRQDPRRLVRIWAVGLPVAAIVGIAGVQFANLALSATDAMCGVVIGGDGSKVAGRFSDVMAGTLTSGLPMPVQMIVYLLIIAGTLLVWLELILRAAGVYIAMFFMPLALAGYVWPATASMAKRTVELLSALILSKFVIVAALTLGLAALDGRSAPDSAIAASAILLLAGFAPFSLLRLAPVVEAAAIGHLEGVARRPFKAASRAVTTAAAAPAHPVARLLLARASSSGQPIQPSPVVAQPLAHRLPDYPPVGERVAADG
jgi:hypothetical protein